MAAPDGPRRAPAARDDRDGDGSRPFPTAPDRFARGDLPPRLPTAPDGSRPFTAVGGGPGATLRPMETSETTSRNDAILAGLAGGPLSTAELVERTGMIERRVERGLRQLVGADYVFSPVRGTYRLTARGRAVLPSPPESPPAPAHPGKRPVRRPLDVTL